MESADQKQKGLKTTGGDCFQTLFVCGQSGNNGESVKTGLNTEGKSTMSPQEIMEEFGLNKRQTAMALNCLMSSNSYRDFERMWTTEFRRDDCDKAWALAKFADENPVMFF